MTSPLIFFLTACPALTTTLRMVFGNVVPFCRALNKTFFTVRSSYPSVLAPPGVWCHGSANGP